MKLGIDLKEFDAKLKHLVETIQRENLVKVVLSRGFVRSMQVYLQKQMDAGLKAGGDLSEGQVREVRGAMWPGWKTRQRRAYGSVVVDSTRYYFRKYRRGQGRETSTKERVETLESKWVLTGQQAVELGRLKRFLRTAKSTRQGTLKGKDRKEWENKPVSERPWEKVWRNRASGKRYSESSKMMLDTGRMRAGLISMRVRLLQGAGRGVIELRPTMQVTYFARQNQLRPMFHMYIPDDLRFLEKTLAEFMSKELASIVNQAVK